MTVIGVIDGVIEGGLGFVWAAYGISAAVFLAYSLSLWLRSNGQHPSHALPDPGAIARDEETPESEPETGESI